MDIKKHVYRQVFKRKLKEGITDEGRPDLKYYAFDWDDNVCFMPTKIILLNDKDDEVGMSTEDFAEHRNQIGVEPFNYKGTRIVDFAKNPFRNFNVEGDKKFIIDSMVASPGPSWNDFVECINGGSIFAIITARGHNPEALKEAVLNFILSNHNGINSKLVVENLKKYRELESEELSENVKDLKFNDKEIIDEYLSLCKFHPVSFGSGSATNPEQGKIDAMRKFIAYCQVMAEEVSRLTGTSQKAVFKNDVLDNESFMEAMSTSWKEKDDVTIKGRKVRPKIGFSDDDPRNVEKMKEFLSQEYPEENPVNVYLTKGGEKIRYNR